MEIKSLTAEQELFEELSNEHASTVRGGLTVNVNNNIDFSNDIYLTARKGKCFCVVNGKKYHGEKTCRKILKQDGISWSGSGSLSVSDGNISMS